MEQRCCFVCLIPWAQGMLARDRWPGYAFLQGGFMGDHRVCSSFLFACFFCSACHLVYVGRGWDNGGIIIAWRYVANGSIQEKNGRIHKSTENKKMSQYSRIVWVDSVLSLVYLTRRRRHHKQSRSLVCCRGDWVPLGKYRYCQLP